MKEEALLQNFLDPIARVWGNTHQFLTVTAASGKGHKNRDKKKNNEDEKDGYQNR